MLFWLNHLRSYSQTKGGGYLLLLTSKRAKSLSRFHMISSRKTNNTQADRGRGYK